MPRSEDSVAVVCGAEYIEVRTAWLFQVAQNGSSEGILAMAGGV